MAFEQRINIGALHGYATRFSPFFPTRMAMVAAQHFGIAGCGELILIEKAGAISNSKSSSISWEITRRLQWPDGLYDLAWSEQHENHIITTSGDGSVQLWDVNIAANGPLQVFREHAKEVCSVDWSSLRGEPHFLTASWDGTAKLWDPTSALSLRTFVGHSSLVYCVVWSPHQAGIFATAGGDYTVKQWDCRQPTLPALSVLAGDGEILSCDYNKYLPEQLVTAGVDSVIRGFDLRNPKYPLFSLNGHRYGVRRVRCSPHFPDVIASVSYDFTCRTWSILPQPHPIEMFEDHTEFVVGLDFSLHEPGLLVDCSWDESVTFRRLTSC